MTVVVLLSLELAPMVASLTLLNRSSTEAAVSAAAETERAFEDITETAAANATVDFIRLRLFSLITDSSLCIFID